MEPLLLGGSGVSDQVSALAVRSHEENALVWKPVAVKWRVWLFPLWLGWEAMMEQEVRTFFLKPVFCLPLMEGKSFAICVSVGTEEAEMIC